MTRVSPCLRRLFIIINIFFVIAGGLTIIISLALLSPSLEGLHGQDDFGVQTTSHIVLYIVGSVTMVIAILGVYGAHNKNLVALTVFLVCMVIGSLLMLRAGVPAATARPQLKSLMEERCRSLLPLDQAPDDSKSWAEALQSSLHCCGLFSYTDWEDNIPDSCLCSAVKEEDKCQTVKYRNFLSNLFWQKRSVFTQPCFPLIMVSVTTNANITLGVVFTLFVLALLCLVLSSLMICQMINEPNAPLSVPLMFTDRPPAYNQLFNLPE